MMAQILAIVLWSVYPPQGYKVDDCRAENLTISCDWTALKTYSPYEYSNPKQACEDYRATLRNGMYARCLVTPVTIDQD